VACQAPIRSPGAFPLLLPPDSLYVAAAAMSQSQTVSNGQDPFAFCRAMLPRVSRTFAINIGVLEGELHRAVLCAYLFCRIVDTVEDAPGLALPEQLALLDEYAALFMSDSPAPDAIAAWINRWHQTTETADEFHLIKGTDLVFAAFAELPPDVKSSVTRCVVAMAAGMKQTLQLPVHADSAIRILPTETDLNQYCYFVAGTVGRMLTELFCHYAPEIDAAARVRLIQLDEAFARGLQITNIIKDCRGDADRGWCYVPLELLRSRGISPEDFFAGTNRPASLAVINELTHKTATYLESALEYTLLLPRRRRRLRLFNLWSLFFAARTLALAWNNPHLLEPNTKVKITRSQVYRTMARTTLLVGRDQALRRDLQRILKPILSP